MTEEKTYVIPLRSRWLRSPKYKRSKRAVGALREYLSRHLKRDVRIGKYLNHAIWSQGHKMPPGKVKVRIEEDKETMTAELFDAPRAKKEEKVKKKEVKAEETKQEVKEEKKTETKVEVKPEKVEQIKEKPIVAPKKEVKAKVGH